MSGNQERAVAHGAGTSAEKSLKDAFDAFHAGRLDRAQELAKDVSRSAPQREEAWCLLAAVAKQQGRLSDAAMALREGIAKNPRSAGLFTALGLLLREVGRFDEAHTALQHAALLNPSDRDAVLQFGNLLAHMGRMEEAEEQFRKAAASHPGDARIALQIGRALLARGRTHEARSQLEAAAKISKEALDPNADHPQDVSVYMEAATSLGELLLSLGERTAALDYFYDCVLLDGGDDAKRSFAECVNNIPFTTPEPLLKPLLTRALAEAWITPQDLIRQCAQQLLLDPNFSAAAERIELQSAESRLTPVSPDVAKLAADPLLQAMLVTCPIPDSTFERVLTALRKMFLDTLGTGALEPNIPFIVALASQCYATGYIYAVSPAEKSAVDALAGRVAASVKSGAEIAPASLAVLAAYRPLYEMDCSADIAGRAWPDVLKPLIEQQLIVPQRDAERMKAIARITPITNGTSLATTQRHDSAPPLRWGVIPSHPPRFLLSDWVQRTVQDRTDLVSPRDPSAPIDVLIVGVRRDTMIAARRFINATVLAVDLSRARLAHAQQKAQELGLTNTTFAQADLLELDGLGRQFDVIECEMVLDQLDDPLAGWKMLRTLLKPGGYLLAGLPSRQGRRDVAPAQHFATERGYGTSEDDLRRLRADILALPTDDPVRTIVKQRDEFYNLGALRNLLFHDSKQFAIADISAALNALGLEFCGFAIDPETRGLFRDRFGAEGRMISLKNWEAFEAEYPDTFSAMYNFLVRKPN